MATSVRSSRFSQAVVTAMRRLYPESLADKSFDNTGLLLEAPARPGLNHSVLLTVDLTEGVTDEAIKRNDSIIISYHPIIFRGLKSLTLANSQQRSLLRLAQHGISIYCPHTAVDAAKNGLGDWLEKIVTGSLQKGPEYQSSVIQPVTVPGHEDAGSGRIIHFAEPQSLQILLKRIAGALSIATLSVAMPRNSTLEESPSFKISSVALCAGSGGSMLAGLEVDMLFTGELSHHDALAEVENGKVVVTALHSNTERGFLEERMRLQLSDELAKSGEHFTVDVSKVDKDPFEPVP